MERLNRLPVAGTRTSTATGFGIGFDIGGIPQTIGNLTCGPQFQNFFLITTRTSAMHSDNKSKDLSHEIGIASQFAFQSPLQILPIFSPKPALQMPIKLILVV
jgi:hypothetical protein